MGPTFRPRLSHFTGFRRLSLFAGDYLVPIAQR
jgi:hypothetical protein